MINFAVHKKGSKSNFLERNTIFCKRILLRSDTFLCRFQTCWNTLYVKMRTKVVKLQKTHSSMQISIPNLTQKQTIFRFNSIFSIAKPRLYFLKSCISTLEEYHQSGHFFENQGGHFFENSSGPYYCKLGLSLFLNLRVGLGPKQRPP